MAGENAVRRGRLFDLYARQPGHEDLTQGRFFWCPLCRRPFEREATAGDNPRVTLAHIIPESLGGTWATIACAECNNGHGHEIEADLLASHRFTDWVAGRATMKVRMGEGGKVRAESRRDPESNHLAFDVTRPMINPAVRLHKERLKGIAQNPSEEPDFKINFQWFLAEPIAKPVRRNDVEHPSTQPRCVVRCRTRRVPQKGLGETTI